jgi:hypothetical protein
MLDRMCGHASVEESVSGTFKVRAPYILTSSTGRP